MTIKNGFVFCDDGVFRKTDLETNDGIIKSIGTAVSTQEALDAEGLFVVPGLVDMHIHGADDADFGDASEDSINKMAKFLLKNGVTSFLGTSLSLSEEHLTNIYSVARQCTNKSIPGQAALVGINMEGPFFNVNKRGAQNEKHIKAPDFEMFTRLYEASGKNIRSVAIAPETDSGFEFIKKAREICNVSVAHSSADYNTALAAFTAGAGSITHAFNGMSPFHHRDPGIIGAAADFGVYAELICDGVHVHPSVVRAVFQMFGADKICLISDAMRACGLPDDEYEMGGQTAIVANGSANLADGALAGSIMVLTDCLRQAIKFGIPIESALKATTINPAKAIGLDNKIGSLLKGKQADILLFDRNFELKSVYTNAN